MNPTKRDTEIFKLLSEAYPNQLALEEILINGKATFCIMLIQGEDSEATLTPLALITNEEVMKDVVRMSDVKLLKLNRASTMRNLLGEPVLNHLK